MISSIQLVLRIERTNTKGEAPVYLRIIKNRKSTFISTGVKIEPKYWDLKKLSVKPGHPNCGRLNSILSKIKLEYQDKLLKIETDNLSSNIKSIKDKLSGNNNTDFFAVAKGIADKYLREGRISSHDKVMSTIRKLEVFTKKSNMPMLEMDVHFLNKYELYLQTQIKNKVNTIHKDMRFIRQVFNHAIKEGLLTSNDTPFLKYKMKTEKTYRVFLHQEEVHQLANCCLDGKQHLKIYRDMFLFSCYAGGLRISDVLCLKVSSLIEGRIYFTIRKTGIQTSFKLPPQALDIVEKYLSKNMQVEDYIFPVIGKEIDLSNPIEADRAISCATVAVNKGLKLIAKEAKLSKHISFHISRHTYATLALKLGVRIEYVQKVLGHADIKETQIYAKIVNEELDGIMENFRI